MKLKIRCSVCDVQLSEINKDVISEADVLDFVAMVACNFEHEAIVYELIESDLVAFAEAPQVSSGGIWNFIENLFSA